MKLNYMPGACSLATHIVLEWIGKPYETQAWSHDQLHGPEFLKVNPAGSVPAIQDSDGWTLTENVAILHYLAELNPEAQLNGDGTPRGRAEVNRWLAFVNSDMHPTFKPYFGTVSYLDEADAAKVKAASGTRLRGQFEIVDKQLAGREWLVGARSIADPYLFVLLRWTRAVKLDLAGLANLTAFTKRMEADAGVRAAMKAEGLD